MVIAQHARKISHWSEDKYTIERLKKIILVTRQDVTRPQSTHSVNKSRALVRQCDTENGEIHRRDIRWRKK